MAPTRKIVLLAHQRIAGGKLLLVGPDGARHGDPRLVDVLDRVRAGDSVQAVARDFGVDAADVHLLAEAARLLPEGND